MLVVITGASQGIGEATALAFAREPGARLALLATRREALEGVASACTALGAAARAFVCDITSAEQVARTAIAVQAWAGTPRVLVNNAGRYAPTTVLDAEDDVFCGQIEANLTGAFRITRAFAGPMAAARAGSIYFVCSVASLAAYPGGLAYTAAKHGLLGLARGVREDLRPHGVRVTAVLPGPTRTPSWDGVPVVDGALSPASDVAEAIVACERTSALSCVEELLIKPVQRFAVGN